MVYDMNEIKKNSAEIRSAVLSQDMDAIWAWFAKKKAEKELAQAPEEPLDDEAIERIIRSVVDEDSIRNNRSS